MLMVLGVDMVVGWHVKVKVEPIFGGVEYKKGEQLVPPVDYNLQHLNQAHQSSDLNRSLVR
jgi:hypothetical protein